ncbi:uncharacterized protein KGF55_000806 [Candida pseudojiufengensis]|uniref:uncharacterized protein n=1 Tax=Candida pseudojiufengensis TaxID=497109 RepID=UPI0022248EE6|nr:uncharacterized protein KGF55_000806 [Candida pseudojiufengensis]KAI5966497.1 hypothetical protein KGF55_000806 [Candida pseudojiufengensis]
MHRGFLQKFSQQRQIIRMQLSISSFSLLVFFAANIFAHYVPGFDSLRVQASIAKRANNLMDPAYTYLPDKELDFINAHLKKLTNFNGTKCDQCKNKIRYGKSLIEQYPDQQHLVSLLLFKYCIVQNNGTESKCDNNDFFVTTQNKGTSRFNNTYDSGYGSETSVNFYDNDFLHMLRNFNTSSELDLEYYCFFKGSSACKLPKTKDVDEFYGVQSWFPPKQPQHYFPPVYKNNSEKFNVLHITDFHIQPQYALGTETNCSQNICGFKDSFNKDLPGKDYNFTSYYKKFNPNISSIELSFYPDARYENSTYIKGEYYDYPKYRGWNFVNAPATNFGAYLSDSPELLMNSSLIAVAKMHKEKDFELVVFNGDIIDHSVITCTPERTKHDEIRGFTLMKHYWDNIPVLPSLGNFPYGQLPPLHLGNESMEQFQYNIDEMANLWINNEWFEEKDRNDLKRHYAGFSYVTNRGLKVIGLNSNSYYQKNLYSYVNLEANPDQFGTWKFLIDELVESEQKGQRVWIQAHIPVTDFDALPLQSRIFGKIIERFSPYTVANIFYGHTHQDEYHVLLSGNATTETAEEKDLVNLAWVLQSITPLTNYNPSWRYYEVENESFNIINSYNYYALLNETFVNGGDEPNWKFEYSARDLYDPDHKWPLDAPLNATFWQNNVIKKLANESDIEFSQLFAEKQFRYGPGTPKCANGTVISDKCYNEILCVMTNFYSDDYQACLRD